MLIVMVVGSLWVYGLFASPTYTPLEKLAVRDAKTLTVPTYYDSESGKLISKMASWRAYHYFDTVSGQEYVSVYGYRSWCASYSLSDVTLCWKDLDRLTASMLSQPSNLNLEVNKYWR